MEWWWDLLAAMDAHEGQAAWAAALGTVVAIFASTLIAIAVPLHMRDIEQRERANDAVHHAKRVAYYCKTVVDSLFADAESKSFTVASAVLHERAVGIARKHWSAIALESLTAEAGDWVYALDAQLATLERLACTEEQGTSLVANPARLIPLRKQQNLLLAGVDAWEVKRINGVWRVYASEDPIATAARTKLLQQH